MILAIKDRLVEIGMMIRGRVGMIDFKIEAIDLETIVLDIIDNESVIINLIAQEMVSHIDLMIVHSIVLGMIAPIHNTSPLLDPHPQVFIGVKIASHFCERKKILTISQNVKE